MTTAIAILKRVCLFLLDFKASSCLFVLMIYLSFLKCMIMIQSVSELLKVKKGKAGTIPSHFFVVVGDWGGREDSNNSIIFK